MSHMKNTSTIRATTCHMPVASSLKTSRYGVMYLAMSLHTDQHFTKSCQDDRIASAIVPRPNASLQSGQLVPANTVGKTLISVKQPIGRAGSAACQCQCCVRG